MCGIVGVWDTRNAIDTGVLERMRDTLRHRGPDDRGVFVDDESNVGLGHQRLSILDPTPAGHQPMGRDGVWAVHNGEIYNFREVREKLADGGSRFTSESDTEVIIAGYRRWGTDVAHEFRGMFATALWDRRARELVILRDRAGVKPLYYYHDGGLFVFGSELRAVVAHPAVPRQIDFAALSLYLKLGYVPAPLSIFHNIFKLEAGHALILDGEGHLETRQYWNVFDCFRGPETVDAYRSDGEAADALEDVLRESFKLRMVSDVPVGIFLSGGVDSSTVTALLQSQARTPIRTFTIGFEHAGFNEAEQARRVAEHLGTKHHEAYCTTSEAREIIPRLADIYDEPFGDASGIPTYLLSRFAREHVKVALSADGGDEIFAGYGHHRNLARTYERLSRLGPSSRHAGALLGMFPVKQLARLKVGNIEQKIKKLNELARKEPSMAEFFFVGRSVWPEEDITTLLQGRARGFDEFIGPYLEEERQIGDFTNWMRAADYRSYLGDDILVKVDRAAMATGLEGRDPFLDPQVIEFASRLPLRYLVRDGDSKYLLRQVLYRHVPRDLVDRPKQGFGVPLNDWLKADLKHLLFDYLGEASVRREAIFEWELVGKEIDYFLQGRIPNCSRLWLLLAFEMWRRKWLK
ncbi:MAG: asparagine synthase (glutamine-hydrolyzing) [Candidatus Krumholzibacteriia bacterium]